MTTRLPAVVSATRGAYARAQAAVLPKTGQELVDRALAALAELVRPLLASPRAASVIVQDQAFTAGTPLAISHRLGRAFQGWTVHRVRTNGSTFVETANATSALDAVQVTITASATCIADVEVW